MKWILRKKREKRRGREREMASNVSRRRNRRKKKQRYKVERIKEEKIDRSLADVSRYFARVCIIFIYCISLSLSFVLSSSLYVAYRISGEPVQFSARIVIYTACPGFLSSFRLVREKEKERQREGGKGETLSTFQARIACSVSAEPRFSYAATR